MSDIILNQISFLTSSEQQAMKKVQVLRYELKALKQKFYNADKTITLHNKEKVEVPKNMSFSCSISKKSKFQYTIFIYYYTVGENEELKNAVENIVKKFKVDNHKITLDNHKQKVTMYSKSLAIELSQLKTVYIYRSSPYYTGYLEKEDIATKEKVSDKPARYNVVFKTDEEVLSANTFMKKLYKNVYDVAGLRKSKIEQINDDEVMKKIQYFEEKNAIFTNVQRLASSKPIQQPHFFRKNKNLASNFGVTNISMDFRNNMTDQEKAAILMNGTGGKRGLGMGFLYPGPEVMKKFSMQTTLTITGQSGSKEQTVPRVQHQHQNSNHNKSLDPDREIKNPLSDLGERLGI